MKQLVKFYASANLISPARGLPCCRWPYRRFLNASSPLTSDISREDESNVALKKEKKEKKANLKPSSNELSFFFLLRKNVHLFSLSNLRIIITFTRSTILTIVINTNRFKKYRLERRLYYNDKRVFMNFSGSRSAEIYYPNGSLAIKFSGPPERDCNYQNLPYYTCLRQIDNLVED